MADYSIGDRVKVLWQAKLYDAEVIHVHSSGKVDVAYDIDGSVGIFLNLDLAEDKKDQVVFHSSQGGREKETKTVCSVGGCSKKAYVRGLCDHHRRKPCSVDSCTTKATARGLCNKHGAKGACLREGCTTPAQRKKGGLCFKHTVKQPCDVPGCDTPLIIGKSRCVKHGAYGHCTTDACTSNAGTMRGKCKTHDSKTVACSVEGCSSIAKARGICQRHGANGTCSANGCDTAVHLRGRCCKHGGGSRKVCKEEGCTTLAKARGVCTLHGAYGTCKLEGCATSTISGASHCWKHGGGRNKPCSVAGCTTTSKRKGLCAKHGGGQAKCVSGGCTNKMVGNKWKTCRTHGGLGYCAHTPGCVMPATKLGGNCYKHTSR